MRGLVMRYNKDHTEERIENAKEDGPIHLKVKCERCNFIAKLFFYAKA